MSGFVGILNLNGAPVDGALLARMAGPVAARGPDAQEVWCTGNIGLAHALLWTTREAERERQPFSLEDRLWIVFDGRIDARSELIETLNSKQGPNPGVTSENPDCELLLRAYAAWGRACVEHLIGDFSFAIWDASERRLFCARDHFGVKLLYYARLGDTFIFSNSQEPLFQHPDFSPTLCDAAIGDFLLISDNLHPTLTSFEQILRLPPAHTLQVTGNQLQTRRFWTMPIEEPLRYRRSGDYVQEFQHLLSAAVQDRLRVDRISMCTSGGLDSPSVAAEAVRHLSAPDHLLGIVYGYERLISDREPAFARLVAEHLKISFRFMPLDGYRLFERCDTPEFRSPWPMELTLEAANRDIYAAAGSHSRVLLTGEGGDVGLVPSLDSYRRTGFLRLLADVGKYFLTHGRHPRLGFGLAWKKLLGKTPPAQHYPRWINEDFETRLNLRDRWQELMRRPSSEHPFRPESYGILTGPDWGGFFERYDFACAQVPMEARHPLFDVRLQRFFLRLPVMPWCADKELLRIAMRGRLPNEIVKRPKAPFRGDPTGELLKDAAPESLNNFEPAPLFSKYIDQSRIPILGSGAREPDVDFRALNLNYWLQWLDSYGNNLPRRRSNRNGNRIELGNSEVEKDL